jgi:hypothetical protein
MHIVDYQDSSYLIKRAIPRHVFKSEIDADLLKQWVNCDTILHRDDMLYFCTKIPDAEIIEE